MNQQVNAPDDPWVVQDAKQSAPVPPGMYLAAFKGVADHTLQQTGEVRWRWAWAIKSGPHAGHEATALTDRSVNAVALSGRLIEGLIGQPLKPGDNVKALVEACVGKPYMVSVQAGPKGGKPGVKSVGQPPEM